MNFYVTLNLSTACSVWQTGHAIKKEAEEVFVQVQLVEVGVVEFVDILELKPVCTDFDLALGSSVCTENERD